MTVIFVVSQNYKHLAYKIHIHNHIIKNTYSWRFWWLNREWNLYNYSFIVQVQVGLRTKYETRDISWSVSPTCASQDELAVASNAFYKKDCPLVVGQSYTIECTSYTGEGWNSNLLIIENNAYCQNFTIGIEETENVTITGNRLFLPSKVEDHVHHVYWDGE